MPYSSKEADRACRKRIRQKNPEKVRKYHRDYYAAMTPEQKNHRKTVRAEYRKKNKEKIDARIKEWGKRNPDKVKKYYDTTYTKLKANPKKYMMQSAKSRAKKNGLEFCITEEDIDIPKLCPVLNKPFKFDTLYSMSLDRIDNSKGYVKGNVQVISYKANAMKYSASKEELIVFAKWVIKEYNNGQL